MDRQKINAIILEMQAATCHYSSEKKEKGTTRRTWIQTARKKLADLRRVPAVPSPACHLALGTRPFAPATHTQQGRDRAVVDFDMFYAAVEIRGGRN